jgi:SAM-dependent methyltransferase
MKEISLDELPRWSPWPKRLLSLETWSVPLRDSKKIETEYNVDKYGALLRRFGDTRSSAEVVRQAQFDLGDNGQLCVSKGLRLYTCRINAARKMERALVLDALRTHAANCQSIVELGCGYGFNLSLVRSQYPEKQVCGGDFSDNAVTLGKHLGMDVRHFDFYSESSYDFLSRLPHPILVFTCHAIEQIPDATLVVKNLRRFSTTVARVVHLEPSYELQGDSLLGMMRRRYIEVNDYNRNLVSLVRSFSATIEQDILGINPLNPTSRIEWLPNEEWFPRGS